MSETPNPIDQLVATWNMHSQITLLMLQNISTDEALDTITPEDGRTVGQVFADIHNVRLRWLEVGSPGLFDQMERLNTDSDEELAGLTRQAIYEALQESGWAIGELLKEGFAHHRLRGFTPHPAIFLGYLIPSESYDRGQACATLGHSGLYFNMSAFGLDQNE